MKALVLGGSGFIGSHIVLQLAREGHDVTILDRKKSPFLASIQNLNYVLTDWNRIKDWTQLLKDSDVVFHLVSTTLPNASNDDTVHDVSSNLVPTLKLLGDAVKGGSPRIVFLSSGGTVYGIPEQLPIHESHKLAPICSYGIVKLSIEKYLQMYHYLYGLQFAVIRPSNPYGPNQSHIGRLGFITTALFKLAHNKPITIWGDGSIVRDYFYVSDLATLCVQAAQTDESFVINAGSGQGSSLSEVLSVVEEVTGKKPIREHAPGRKADVAVSTLDIGRAKALLGWAPTVSLAQGIERTWQWICLQTERDRLK